MASRLAERKHCTVTEAVRGALEDALRKVEDERAAKLRKIDEILEGSMRCRG